VPRFLRGVTYVLLFSTDIYLLVVGLGLFDLSGVTFAYLLPRGLVLVANKKNVTSFEHHKKLVADQKQKIIKQAQAVADQLTGASLAIPVRAGEEGRLFDSVTNI
jgi:ribosomal protein L9